MNTNSTHYRYFDGKKQMAKRLSELESVVECDDYARSSMVSEDG